MASDIRARFGARVRKLRRQKGWSQVELAERFGIDRSYIADIERGKRNVCLFNIELIAKGFGLSLSQLFSRI